jgi:hypothetical protein
VPANHTKKSTDPAEDKLARMFARLVSPEIGLHKIAATEVGGLQSNKQRPHIERTLTRHQGYRVVVEDDNLNLSDNPGTGLNEFDPTIEKHRTSIEGILPARIRLSSVFRVPICLH